MRPVLLLATLSALAAVACGPAPTPAPSAEPEQRRKAGQPGPAVTARPDGSVPYAMEWKRNLPERVTITLKESTETSEAGVPVKKVDFTYSPSPPDIMVELAPAPGTPSFEIAAVELTWTFNVPGDQDATKIGPEKLPIAPVKVTGAPSDQPGPSFRVQVPLGVMSLKPHFTNADASKRVSQAYAQLRFLDDKGRGIFGRNTAVELKVPIPVVLL